MLGVSLNQNHVQALGELAKRHQILSGQKLNWLETYEHGAERFVKHVEKFR